MMEVKKLFRNDCETKFEDLDDGAIFIVPGYDKGIFIKTAHYDGMAIDLNDRGKDHLIANYEVPFGNGEETVVVEVNATLTVELKGD